MHLSTLLWSVCLVSTITMSEPRDGQAPLQASIEALNPPASTTYRQAVPGDSPAVYIDDPSDDLLSIDALDLQPNPQVE